MQCISTVRDSWQHLLFLPERDYVTFESLLSQIRLSVCNVGAPYSGGWSFRQNFFTALYAGHVTSVQNFTVQYFPVHCAGVPNMYPHYNLSQLWRYVAQKRHMRSSAAPGKKTTDLFDIVSTMHFNNIAVLFD